MNLHVYNPIPHLGPSAVFFVSAVESLCYSMGHKCEDDAGKALFTAWVAICEHIGKIGADDTLMDVTSISFVEKQIDMKPRVAARARQRVPLRGGERTLSMVDGVSTKIVHSMLVRGATSILLRYLAPAVMNTFNLHPRMRTLQVKGERFLAEVRPPLTRNDVTSFALVRVRMVSSVASDADDMMSGWEQYADDECSIGFDRFKQLPFFLTVWVDARERSARLMLFSDHYMSDGYSGLVVLNGILEQVAIQAGGQPGVPQDEPEPEQPPLQLQELPLRPSLYKMWLSRVAWAKPIMKKRRQHQFRAPPVTSGTTALFSQGDPECMKKAVAKCKEENVTVSGALVGVTLLAFFHVMKERKSNPSHECFKLAADLGFNMRRRVPSPVEEDQVGMYTAVTCLDWLAEGVDMRATGFWDLARRAKQEFTEKPKHTLAMVLPTVVMDKKINSQMQQSFLKGVYLPHSLTLDVSIFNVGRYPYATEHQLSEEDDGILTVESLHVYHPLPHLASSATFFVNAVDAFNYSMAHKCENVVGEALFAAIVELCEGIGRIGTNEKLLDVLNRVGLRYTGHNYT
ncbi:hypothetical protein PHYPSEUDO_010861 [Phytophthora pseudosyringae]|uniref:Condensation domain-containing protein n=1 Tax=Phytophthora pseudosyringae TaxID=221518 RepID=A0A8T1V9D2_9STRA|nr:hypothetical protein PHYPSEUDO_010861 [Phytophthora pseudosyringae]